MGNFGYIFGYAIIFAFLIGGLVGYFAGYFQRRHEEPQEMQRLVDGWKKKSRL